MIANSSYLSVFLEFMEECVRVERSCVGLDIFVPGL